MEQETENKETGNLAAASDKADDHEAVPGQQLSEIDQNHDVNIVRSSNKTPPFEESNNRDGDTTDKDPVEEDPVEEDLIKASDVQIPKDNKVETENPVEDTNIPLSKEDTCEIENLPEASKTALSREINNKTETSNAALSIEINNGTGNPVETSNHASSKENNIETENPVEPSNTSASKNNAENLMKAPMGAESSKKGTPKSLKASSKVVEKKTSANLTLQKPKGVTSKNVNSQGNKSQNEDIDSGILNSANKQMIEVGHEISKKQGKNVGSRRNMQKQKAEGESKGDGVNSKKPSSGGENTQTTFANEHPTDKSIEKQEVGEKNKDKGAKDPTSGGDSRHENAANDNLVEGEKGSNKKRKRIRSGWAEMIRNNDDANSKNLSLGEERRQNNDAKRQRTEKGQEANKKSKSEQKRKAPGGSDRNAKDQRNTEKGNTKQKSEKDGKKKEKLGGLIFMCSKKTKPDCFHYHVMGMNINRKDLVLGIKPGLKLFLYDFDLKLMYGIYKASSSGGLKLEPKAFGGGFPVQVRFSILKDCNPLPESTFKKAIKENYDKKNKFSAELTVQQTKKLSALFQAAAPLKAHKSVRLPPAAPNQDREPREGVRKPRSRSEREVFVRDDNGRSYHSREVVATKRDEPPRDLFLSEREYRTYGLPRERRQLSPPFIPPSADLYVRDRERPLSPPRIPPSVDLYVRDRERQVSPPRSYVIDREKRLAPRTYAIDRERHRHIPASIDPYTRNRERELPLGQSNSSYRERVPYQREAAYVDSHYVDSHYQSASGSGVGVLNSHARDSYYAHRYGADAYLPSRGKEEVPLTSYYADGRRAAYLDAADSIKRTETDRADRLYSRYVVDAPSNRRQVEYERVNPETAPLPVSSRYSFGSPSLFR